MEAIKTCTCRSRNAAERVIKPVTLTLLKGNSTGVICPVCKTIRRIKVAHRLLVVEPVNS